MPDRAFPITYASDVGRAARFYEALGFERHFQLPEQGEPGYVGLRRGPNDLAVVSRQWPQDRFGVEAGTAPRFEMFVYVDDVDAALAAQREAGTRVLREPEDMPWGERVAYVADPDGTPVALAAPIVQP